jgi:hypothetical protein
MEAAPIDDTSCTTDSDCTLVPPGGDVCDPCLSNANAQVAFLCATVPMNQASASAFLASLQPTVSAVLSAQSSPSTSFGGCAPSACADAGVAVCVNKTCTVPDAGTGP